MAGKTYAQVQADQAAKLNQIRAEQSALRVESGRRIEAERQAAEAEKDADRARVLEARLRLRESDPAAWYALNDGLRLEALRWESERQGRGGRKNRDSEPQQFSGFVDPRYPKLKALQANDPDKYESELSKLSAIDKMNFGRWLAVQARS